LQSLLTIASWLTGSAIIVFARFVTAVRGIWQGSEPDQTQRVFFANHCSHGDFVLLWTVLPAQIRKRTRPVAGADYWLSSGLRRFIGCKVFNSVLIERKAGEHKADAKSQDQITSDPAIPDRSKSDPISQMLNALDAGDSLIVFPEGTRNTTQATLLPFKSGLYHVANQRPNIELVPVWISNLNRVLPKGEIIPIPLVCTVTFGAPVQLQPGEGKQTFIQRAEAALRELAPGDLNDE